MKTTLFALFSAVSTLAIGQITVTNATFPAAGDTLKLINDLNPTGVSITAAGGPYTWDFSQLGFTTSQQIVFKPASEGMAYASFPTATLFTSIVGEQGETYYGVDASAFSLLGFSGTGPTGGLPIPSDLKYNPPLIERYAPLNFIDNHVVSTNLSVAFSLDQIPSEVLDSFGIPSDFVDSIRIRIATNRSDLVDAYGTLTIPGGTYEVLREKRITYIDTRIEIYTFIGWSDITDLVGDLGGFGKDTTTTYVFQSNTAKEPIATVTTDQTGMTVEEVAFKDNGVINNIGDPTPAGFSVQISPNPASSHLTISFEKMQHGTVTLRLIDMKGNVCDQQRLTAHTTDISLQSLAPGLYIYQITDDQHRILTTGKVVKE